MDARLCRPLLVLCVEEQVHVPLQRLPSCFSTFDFGSSRRLDMFTFGHGRATSAERFLESRWGLGAIFMDKTSKDYLH